MLGELEGDAARMLHDATLIVTAIVPAKLDLSDDQTLILVRIVDLDGRPWIEELPFRQGYPLELVRHAACRLAKRYGNSCTTPKPGSFYDDV